MSNVIGVTSLFPGLIALVVLGAFVVFATLVAFASRYKKCPSDRIMVIYGKTRGTTAAQCIHGGAKFVWPIWQDYGYISLRPMQIEVNLDNALCKQNIRISVPSVFTVGVSIDPGIMNNAAERLFGLLPTSIAELAKDIIFGQLRLVIASMTIEEINADRETFLKNVEQNVTDELNKVGLLLLNVNITDITDESGYISAIGKRAASEAINQARVEVAEEERKGGTGEAEAKRTQRIAVAKAEAEAQAGEANAERDRRIALKQADATATEGENISAIEIAKSNALRSEQEAEAFRKAETARKIAEAQILKSQYDAEKIAQTARTGMETEKQRAEQIVPSEIHKQQVEIAAEAEAEKRRREARGEADAIFARLDAEARGNFEILKAKGEGFSKIIESCNGDTDAAAKMLLIEKLEAIVSMQTEAIKNIKIDKVTVWEGGAGKDGKTSTANFLSGMMQSLPPLHDVASMAGINLPGYLGNVKNAEAAVENAPKA
ncbi:MAG: flotillin [Lentisphaerae bacterium GWF2_45_14]|nr:MAG: flotillin [Lentisphaerae bacterium GWF2_45_14]